MSLRVGTMIWIMEIVLIKVSKIFNCNNSHMRSCFFPVLIDSGCF